jgi:hypothetical protein
MPMKVQIISLLLTSFLLFQSGAKDSNIQPMVYDEAEAYKVYSALLQSEWPQRRPDIKKAVIRMETWPFKMCLKPAPESEEIIGSAIDDYVWKNEKPVILQKQFQLEKPYELISANQIKSIFQQGDWKDFYKLYPDSNGYIDFSAVGFNEEKTIAVVYIGKHCGYLCGSGKFHVQQKKDGKW